MSFMVEMILARTPGYWGRTIYREPNHTVGGNESAWFRCGGIKTNDPVLAERWNRENLQPELPSPWAAIQALLGALRVPALS